MGAAVQRVIGGENTATTEIDSDIFENATENIDTFEKLKKCEAKLARYTLTKEQYKKVTEIRKRLQEKVDNEYLLQAVAMHPKFRQGIVNLVEAKLKAIVKAAAEATAMAKEIQEAVTKAESMVGLIEKAVALEAITLKAATLKVTTPGMAALKAAALEMGSEAQKIRDAATEAQKIIDPDLKKAALEKAASMVKPKIDALKEAAENVKTPALINFEPLGVQNFIWGALLELGGTLLSDLLTQHDISLDAVPGITAAPPPALDVQQGILKTIINILFTPDASAAAPPLPHNVQHFFDSSAWKSITNLAIKAGRGALKEVLKEDKDKD